MYRRRTSRPRRRVARRYRRRAPMKKRQSVSAVRKFCFTVKYADVVSALNGTNVDGYTRTPLTVNLGSIPAITSLSNLFRQFAITGAKFDFRTTNPAPNSVTGASILMVQDKDNYQNPSVNYYLSQNDVKLRTAHKSTGMYVSRPRPLLFQQNLAGLNVKVAPPAKQIHWLSPSFGATDVNLTHLCGFFAVSDLTAGATVAQPQGELWLKLYVIAKEQALSGV